MPELVLFLAKIKVTGPLEAEDIIDLYKNLPLAYRPIISHPKDSTQIGPIYLSCEALARKQVEDQAAHDKAEAEAAKRLGLTAP